jgi:hypothetical protein
MEEREIRELRKTVVTLDYDRSLGERVLHSLHRPGFPGDGLGEHYELPTHIEEIYTLRNETSEIHVATGVEEVEDPQGFCLGAMVSIIIPYTGREIRKMVRNRAEEGVLSEMYTDLPTDYIKDYIIVMARDIGSDITEALEDDEFFDMRKKAELEILGILCSGKGFRIFFTESGIMDRRIPDKWIAEREMVRYNSNIRVIENAISETPDSFSLWYKKGGLFLSRDKWDEAEEALKRSLEIDSTFPPALFAMGDTMSAQGRLKEAEKYYKMARDYQRKYGKPGEDDPYVHLDPFLEPLTQYWRVDVWKYDAEEGKTKEDEGPRCFFCGSDFLDIVGDVMYTCNRCGSEDVIGDGVLEVEVEPTMYEFRHLKEASVVVTVKNLTPYAISYDRESWNLHFKHGRESNVGGMKEAPEGVIEPHGTLEVEVALEDVSFRSPGAGDWLLEEEPGIYKVTAIFGGTLEAGGKTGKPWAESRTASFHVRWEPRAGPEE